MKSVALMSLGCKINQYETECIRGQFNLPEYLLVPFEEKAEIYIINTCTVTQRADHKSRQLIRQAIRKNPSALIVATGCYVQRSPEEIASIKGVDLLLGNQEKFKIREAIENFSGNGPYMEVSEISKIKDYCPISLGRAPEQTRAFVKIQDGCDRFCSYCIVPYIRGRSRSRSSQEVINEIENLIKCGFKEIVLCGINLASYGRDLKDQTLAQLIKKIEAIKGLRRVRLSSLDPVEIDEGLIEAILNSSVICPHLHISLQSGDDAILLRMNRGYTTDQYRDLIAMFRSIIPQIAITTDVLVGFPGEDEKSFYKTYRFIEEIGFSNIHIFKYSKREGTAAAKLGDTVPEEVKAERSQRLNDLKKRLNIDFRRRFLDQEVEVLTEGKGWNGYTVGLTPEYIRVFIKGEKIPINQIIKVRIEEVTPDLTLGRISKPID